MKRFLSLVLILASLAFPAEAGASDRITGDGYYLEETADGEWRLYDEGGSRIVDYFWSDAELDCILAIKPGQEARLPFYGFQENGLGIIRMGPPEAQVFGCIDREGEFVIGPAYDFIGEFRHGAAVVMRGSKYGLVHESGAAILPAEYDEITVCANPACTAVKDGRTYDFALWEDQAVPFTADAASIDMETYLPHTGSRTPALDEPASLRLADNLPRLDGATALLPLYCGLAQAVYPDTVRFERTEEAADPVLTFTNTPGAYYRLIHGQCDLIFVASPSDEQLSDAAKAGVELELTPIAAEAFVFFVHADNPLEGLTVEQVRRIYSGRITEWNELGVEYPGSITAYQRPKNSGSQTALESLMGDIPLMDPPSEVSPDGFGMDDIVSAVEYRNTPDALGYSFRFYLTSMLDSDVKLLALDGIAPTAESIANGTYPIIEPIYAVSRKGETNPNVQAVLGWLLSEQGKELIRRCGYAPAP